MPSEAFSAPLSKILDGNCEYLYFNTETEEFTDSKVSRILHVKINNGNSYNDNVILLIFKIRNQNGAWKIHSEGAARLDPGATIPLRNKAVELAMKYGWKFIAVGIANVEEDENLDSLDDVMSNYVVSIESLSYGKSTVCTLTEFLRELERNGLPDFYRATVEKDDTTYSLAFIKRELFTNYLQIMDSRAFPQKIDIKFTKKPPVSGGENVLYYGVPGSGKSHEISEKCNDPAFMERVVFHPDYTFPDFVGQIMPHMYGDELVYEFTQGPFTRIMQKAINDPENMYYLIIEELNRGNAPAIFGDIFQLLDRDEDGKSVYGITNFDVAKEIYDGDHEKLIKIPSNLTILATMNSSDQNVFTLDTAFQRRWQLKHVPNKFDGPYAKNSIKESNITWGAFAVAINNKIVELSRDVMGNSDKRLGLYFVKEKELAREIFAEKVLKYLWDDAFRMDPYIIFDSKLSSLDDVIDNYKNADGDPLQIVLNEDTYNRMITGA